MERRTVSQVSMQPGTLPPLPWDAQAAERIHQSSLLRCAASWFGRLRAQTGSGDFQPDPIKTVAGCQVEGSSVGIAPAHVVRMHWSSDGPQMLPSRRDDPQAAWPGDINVAALVYLHTINGVLAVPAGQVEEEAAVLNPAVRLDLIAMDNFPFIPVADIEIFLVGR